MPMVRLLNSLLARRKVTSNASMWIMSLLVLKIIMVTVKRLYYQYFFKDIKIIHDNKYYNLIYG